MPTPESPVEGNVTARPLGRLGAVRLLCRLQRMVMWGALRGWTPARGAQTVILAVLFLVFFALDCYVSAKVIDVLLGMPPAGELLLGHLLNLLALTVFTLLFYSSIMTMLSTVYASRDLHLLLALPFRLGDLLAMKFVETATRSAFMPALFAAPLLAYLGYRLEGGVWYAATCLAALTLFAIIPCALGMAVCALLAATFPRKRLQQAMWMLGLLVGALVIIVFRAARIERLFDAGGQKLLEDWLRYLEAPAAPWLPSAWAVQALFASADARPWTALLPLGQLLIVAALSLGLYALAARLTFQHGWIKSQESTDPRIPAHGGRLRRWIDAITAPLPRQARLIARKDATLFVRDVSLWSQVFMLIPLLILYLINVKLMHDQVQGLRDVLCFVNLGFAGLLIAGVCARLVFPCVSLEREAVWVVATAPLSTTQLLWGKWCVFTPPVLLLATAIVTLSNTLLGVSPWMQGLALAGVLVFSVTLTGMAVGLGAMYPMFRFRNVVEVSLSLHGVTYMLLAFIYLLLVALLLARPIGEWLALDLADTLPVPLALLVPRFAPNPAHTYAMLATALALSATMFILPMWLGTRALKQREMR